MQRNGYKTSTRCLTASERELIRHALRTVASSTLQADDTRQQAEKLCDALAETDIDVHKPKEV